ncbi:hypothetical protein MG293_012573 [Ovis ammon polii]|uniref:Uncharacterized protein n=1 Tax=Ovis ammon polii TaxID=230172 RepID=A0AAD4U5U0_OVIAM|nr:hypothetical protein MG293_012573 [Ovis ammon polii]KAI4564222.1 hypothetical protein MJT46_010020 [Ovis ammon polii x Ovis aries]
MVQPQAPIPSDVFVSMPLQSKRFFFYPQEAPWSSCKSVYTLEGLAAAAAFQDIPLRLWIHGDSPVSLHGYLSALTPGPSSTVPLSPVPCASITCGLPLPPLPLQQANSCFSAPKSCPQDPIPAGEQNSTESVFWWVLMIQAQRRAQRF